MFQFSLSVREQANSNKRAESESFGAAIYAAVAAGIYPNVIEASKKMGSDFESEYFPESDKVEAYQELMDSYSELAQFIESITQK